MAVCGKAVNLGHGSGTFNPRPAGGPGFPRPAGGRGGGVWTRQVAFDRSLKRLRNYIGYFLGQVKGQVTRGNQRSNATDLDVFNS